MTLDFVDTSNNLELELKDLTAEFFLKKIENIECVDIKITLPSKRNA